MLLINLILNIIIIIQESDNNKHTAYLAFEVMPKANIDWIKQKSERKVE